MLLNRGLSWRQRGRPQLVDPPQDLGEEVSGDGDLCELEGDAAAMAHDLGTDLDQLLPESRQRPVLDLIGYAPGDLTPSPLFLTEFIRRGLDRP